MKLLDDYEIQLFKFSEIEQLLEQKFDNLSEILENLVDKELLVRIEKGKFCKQGFRDEYVIGTFIAENSAVGYWSALNLHGLTEQFSNTVFIQTTHTFQVVYSYILRSYLDYTWLFCIGQRQRRTKI